MEVKPTRREFLWTMGATATALGLHQTQDVFWTAEAEPDLGWAPGIEDHVTSTCLVCPARCGIRARIVDGRLVRISGNPLHPMSRGGLCPRGIAGVQTLYHPERLDSPMVRVGSRGGGEWRKITPEGAVTLLAERLQALREAGRPEGLALLAGYCAGTMHDVWRQFLNAFGSPNHVSDDYDDGTASIMRLMHGIPRRPAYDLDRAELVLSFGAPLFESWWSPLQAFVAFASPEHENGRGARFVQVDTRFSRTAARAHEWVGIRPETHGALALGIAYVLIRDELFDARFLSQHVTGFEEYRSLVLRHFRAEDVSTMTGVPVERITAVAREFARARPAVAVCGSDVMLAPNGLFAGLAVHSLNVLVGSINTPGGVLFGDEPPLEPLQDVVLDDVARAGVARDPIDGEPPPLGLGDPATRFVEAATSDAGASVDTLMLYYANPLASSSRPDLWRQALAPIPYIVSFSPFLDETSRYVDMIIPDLLPYERWQDAPTPVSYPHPTWGVTRPVVEPHDGGIHTGDVLLGLARALGGSLAQSLPYDDFASLLEQRARGLFAVQRGMLLGDEFERRHHLQMEERGWWLPEHKEFDSFWNELIERGGWTDLLYDDADPRRLARTRDGRINLIPAELLAVLSTEGDSRRPYVDVTSPADEPPEEFPLRLVPYRASTLASGTLGLERWMAEQPGVFPNVHWVPWVEVHPETAHSLGLGDNTMVWVISQQGRYRARLKLFHGTAHENVCVPYGLRHPDGELANPLQLLSGSRDSLTGLPAWFSTYVRLERA